MNTAEQLAILTERLSTHMTATNAALAEDREEKKRAAEERHEMLQGLHELRATMAEVKPVTDMVQSLRGRLAGAMIVVGFIGTVAWGGVLFWKEQFIALFGGN